MSNTFDKDLSNFGRNLAGTLATIFGIAAGVLLGRYIFGITKAEMGYASSFMFLISVGQYADSYHRSIVNGMSVIRFAITSLVSSFPGAFVLCLLEHYTHLSF